MKEIDKIAWLYFKDGKILTTLSKGKDTFYLPGGKRENKETDEETLKREIKEELSVNIVDKTIKYYGTFEAQAHSKTEGILVRMTCYLAEFEGELKPDSEIEKLEWFEYSDNDKVSQVDKIIFKDLLEKGLLK